MLNQRSTPGWRSFPLRTEPMHSLELMRIDVDTSFTFDARGRTLQTNEPREDARRPAPRVVVGHTSAGNIVRFNADVPDAMADELEAILADADDPLRSRTALELTMQGTSTEFRAGPAYHCSETPAASHQVVRITAANRELARDSYRWLYDEVADWQPCFAIIRDGSAVSICFSSRISPLACAAGVDTLPEFRARGYASAVTAAWASAVRATARIAFYSTDWDNLASQGVARRLGLTQFGEHLRWK